MSDERILIVDDDPINLKLVKFQLEREGYKVRLAADGLRALTIAANFDPELVVTDIQLPQIDGLELTRRLKRNTSRKVAVIALTAYAMNGDRDRAIESGCDGYITKPIDSRLLLTTIREILDNRKADEKPWPTAGTSGLASPAAPACSKEGVIDVAELEVRVGNDNGLLADLIEMFLVESPRLTEAARSAAAERNARNLQHAAHALKGTVAIFAAPRAFHAATVLENMGAKNDLSEAMAAFGVLDHEVRDLCTELGKIATEEVCV